MASKLMTSMRLSQETVSKIDETAKRLGDGISQAFVIEALVHFYADQLEPTMSVPLSLIAGAKTSKRAKSAKDEN